MPTYEYECEKCAHQFEEFQSIKAPPIEKCPSCGGLVHRLIGTGGGFIFKGSGFYQTDYRSSSYKQKEASEKKTSAPAEKNIGSEKAKTTADLGKSVGQTNNDSSAKK